MPQLSPHVPRPAHAQFKERIGEAFKANASRIIDLFHECDTNGDGVLERSEFKLALPVLGLMISQEEADKLFDWFDDDHSSVAPSSNRRAGCWPVAWRRQRLSTAALRRQRLPPLTRPVDGHDPNAAGARSRLTNSIGSSETRRRNARTGQSWWRRRGRTPRACVRR